VYKRGLIGVRTMDELENEAMSEQKADRQMSKGNKKQSGRYLKTQIFFQMWLLLNLLSSRILVALFWPEPCRLINHFFMKCTSKELSAFIGNKSRVYQ
jgi:hypothetical protein